MRCQATCVVRRLRRTEQQLCAGGVQGWESEFVDEDQVVAQQGVDDLPDGVVGHPSVAGLLSRWHHSGHQGRVASEVVAQSQLLLVSVSFLKDHVQRAQ